MFIFRVAIRSYLGSEGPYNFVRMVFTTKLVRMKTGQPLNMRQSLVTIVITEQQRISVRY